MPTPRTKRIIEIDVTTSKGLRKGIRDVNSQLRSIEGNAKKTSREVTRMSKGFKSMSIAAAAWIALGVARAMADVSDSMILLGARINIVTEETVGVEKAFSDLFDIANATRQSIEATGTLYARLGFSTKALALEHESLLTIVQGVNNTLLLSGASAQESASSIIQLSQAFSKGALDGDEFRSVSEGNVVLFGIMQEVLGKTAGELRQFSRDGQLTAELLAQVLTSQQVRDLQSRVDDIPLTFAQAFTKIKNSFAQMAIELEPLFTTVAGFFDEMAQGFSAGITIGKGFSEGIVSYKELFGQGFGNLEQRLELARKVNIEFDEMYQRDERHRKDVKLGINDERALLNITLERIRVLNTSLTAPENVTGNPLKFSEIAIAEAEASIRTTDAKLKIEREIALTLQKQITSRLQQARDEEAQLKVTIERGKLYDSNVKRFNDIAESIRTPLDVLNETITELEKLQSLGFDSNVLDAAATKAMVDYGEAAFETTKAIKEVKTHSEELGIAIGNTLSNSVSNFADTIYDFATGVETSFSATIQNMIDDIARLVIKMTLLNALETGLSGTGLGDFIFPTANANGNTFSQGNVVPFASGGVVNSPTLFPMSDGVGLMGEAGPEAILPLSRGSDGKLGVSAEGGAKNVSVNIVNNGRGSEVESSTATTDINGTVVNIVLNDIRSGGPIRNAVKGMGEFG